MKHGSRGPNECTTEKDCDNCYPKMGPESISKSICLKPRIQTLPCQWHQPIPSTRKYHKFWIIEATRPNKAWSGPYFRGTAQHEVRDPAARNIGGSSVAANTTSDSCCTTPYVWKQYPKTLHTTYPTDGPITPLPRAHSWHVDSGPDLHERAGSQRPQQRPSRKHGNWSTHGAGINSPGPLVQDNEY